MSIPDLPDLSDRMDRMHACSLSAVGMFAEYHHACAAFEWSQADKVRVRLIETIEASLDATAACFKALETIMPGRDGKG
jgi:hypothetical protein